MTILKKSLLAAIAVATMSTAAVSFSVAPANANHYGTYHPPVRHHAPKYQAPPSYCHWGWVKWRDSYGNWHRKWKNHCNHRH